MVTEKEKTTSVNKYINNHNITEIAQVNIRQQFCTCLRDSLGGRTKTARGINEKIKLSNAAIC